MSEAQVRSFIQSTTAKLAASYLVIIMLMSIGFSIVFYNASVHELGRQLPPPSTFGILRFNEGSTQSRVNDFFQDRIDEGRHVLLLRLFLLNMLALAAGSVVSYYLARRTLEPIEQNVEAQSQFVSDASHELRTPLTSLQTTNEVALRRSKISTKEAKEILQQNIQEVIKLRSLTDSLLRLAKTEKEDMKLSSVSLQEVAAEAMNNLIDRAVAKNISIDDRSPKLKVQADRAGLAQALTTLLDNAIKYSPSKSTIYLEGGQHGKHAFVSVRDEGQGIKPEHLPHIFDRFYRVNKSRNKSQADGYGIGLALADKIIRQQNGEILVNSTPGKGSTFTIQMPLS